MTQLHKPKAPDWALSPLEEFASGSEHLATVVRLSIQGMSMAKALPKAMEALRRADGEDEMPTYTKRQFAMLNLLRKGGQKDSRLFMGRQCCHFGPSSNSQ